MRLPYFSRLLAIVLSISSYPLFAQSAPKPNASFSPRFLLETSQAYHSGVARPELGFVVRCGAEFFIPKCIPSQATANTLLRVNPLGLPSGLGFSTNSLQGTHPATFGKVALYKVAPPDGLQPLSIASSRPQAGTAVKVWLWDKERRQAVELAATIDAKYPDRLALSRRVEQRQVIGAPICNEAGEVFAIGFSQRMGVPAADMLIFLPLKPEWCGPLDGASTTGVRQIPATWRTWTFDGKNKHQAVASSATVSGDSIMLGLWHDAKWIQKSIQIDRLSKSDRDWIKAMINPIAGTRSPVPISHAPTPLAITAPNPGQFPWPLSKAPRRPCLEIDVVAGTVTFRGRIKTADRVFSMTDPSFQTAVKTRTLDQLLDQHYVKYTQLGTLTIPAKLMNFPLLGQDNTGTCYVSHYREWLVYYLGDRALLLPCLENLRGYLNFLLHDNPSLPELFATRDGKSAVAFDARTRMARARSRDFLNNVGFFCRNFLIGADTLPYVEFADINNSHQNWRFSNKTRQFSEALFGSLLEGLLLGHMTLGESESHVMNIIGIDGDRLSVSTWAKEYEGTLRELARMDARGALLAPTVFAQFPVVARNNEGRIVIPSLEPAISSALTPAQLKAITRFNLGSGAK